MSATEPPDILLVYPEGNYIRASDERPFLQIGESKYGKFMLELAVEAHVDLVTAAKIALGLHAEHGTRQPVRRAALRRRHLLQRLPYLSQFRIESDSPLLDKLRMVWERACCRASPSSRDHPGRPDARSTTRPGDEARPAMTTTRTPAVTDRSSGSRPEPSRPTPTCAAVVSARATSATATSTRVRWPITSRRWPRPRPDAFGVCVAGVHGRTLRRRATPTWRSPSRASPRCSCSRWCATPSAPTRRGAKLGVNATGMPFDSVMGVELNADRTMNPMVNAGAMATTSLVPGASAQEKFAAYRRRTLPFRRPAPRSGRGGVRVRGGDQLPQPGASRTSCTGTGASTAIPDLATDVYTRQCALQVTARDLAVMGATLAGGGVNPLTGRAGHRRRAVAAGPGRPGHGRALRGFGRLALRRRPARQERGQWRAW